MNDINKTWSPIEVLTLKGKLIFIEIPRDFLDIRIDHTWGKIIGDGNTLFEFNQSESKNYQLIGTIKQCQENPAMLNGVLDTIPLYEESFNIPIDNTEGWVEFKFIDESGRPYKERGRDFKYRKIIGEQYINYGLPLDVMEMFPLNSILDSFKTLLVRNKLFLSKNDFIILNTLKQLL